MSDKPPSFRLADLERRRDKLFNEAMRPFVGATLDGLGLDRFVASVRDCLPETATRDAVFESVRHLAGRPLEAATAFELAWRMAGNLSALAEGQAVAAWTVQRADEWVPLYCTRAVAARDKRERIGTLFSFRVMAGTPCPMLVTKFLRHGAARHVALSAGFSWEGYPYSHPFQIVGLRILGKIEAARCREKPEFHEIAVPQSLKDWNRKNVLKLRLRVDQTKCPNGWHHACHKCAVGYLRCAAATHKLDYQVGECFGCSRGDAVFDPEDPDKTRCMDCNRKQRLAKKG